MAAFATIDRCSSLPVRHRIPSSAVAAASASSTSSALPPRCPSAGAAFFFVRSRRSARLCPPRRTLTVDYVVVISGEAVLCLGDGVGGDEKPVHAGDVVVQQGTQHAWWKRMAVACRLVYMMLAGKKIELADGTVLKKKG
ncbi:MAG: hypothetical protein STHCBS139747_005006 [Sporothrix thermara]